MKRLVCVTITDNTCAADRQARVRVMANVPVRAVTDNTCAALNDLRTVLDNPEINILGFPN